jgi:hypothetical protein
MAIFLMTMLLVIVVQQHISETTMLVRLFICSCEVADEVRFVNAIRVDLCSVKTGFFSVRSESAASRWMTVTRILHCWVILRKDRKYAHMCMITAVSFKKN